MAKTVLAVLPIGSLLQTRFELGEKTAKVNVSLQGFHGDRDDPLPFEQGKAILPRRAPPKDSDRPWRHEHCYLTSSLKRLVWRVYGAL